MTVRVATTTEIVPRRPTANLLATTKTGRVDRQVVVGAHLDSVQEGPGINDNGSGSLDEPRGRTADGQAQREARQPGEVRVVGRRGVGPDGSQFYVDSLTKCIKNTAVNLNFDMVGSPNFVRFVYDGDASDTDSLASTGSGVVEDVFVDYFDSQGLATEPTAFDGRSDYDAFISVGIPAGGLFTGAEEHQDRRGGGHLRRNRRRRLRPCYHQACDDIDNLSKRRWTRCPTRSPTAR